ncbi:hypothetical protein [Denitrobaculum tricleocarpae]|uniref:Uncharacterized protein n=1 Tax=Denitrobaculum tricleocarpae TaxID=2591009 RepID=A0A545T816_9PROT|nr:hypothetical protein [Denitrobaculum tricleocarpae]TQV73369.1 hypothetical protein FKG95_25475 [Denitrobaculum tricleocarpae]
MDISDIDLTELPSGREEAFVYFEKSVRDKHERSVQDDRDFHSDQNNNYVGRLEPERVYISAILAFLDEYNLHIDVPDLNNITREQENDFLAELNNFKYKIHYAVTRFSLRKVRIEDGSVGTTILITSTYKSEIGKLLETIRKIVNQEVTDTCKKDKIFSKISDLQLEVDRDQTTIDALFGRVLSLSKTIGQVAENLTPLLDKLERIKKLIWDGAKEVEALPQKERRKLIPKNLDDKIPF